MRKNILLLCFSLLLALGMGEAMLRHFTLFPITSTSNMVLDERLLYRTGPKAEGVDESGFRTAGGAPPYELVAIGDSHTFGLNVKARDSWPAVASRMLGVSVANLSAGGYDILQYLALMDDALALHPKTVVVGFYPYNDLRRQCRLLNTPYWQEHGKALRLNTACSRGTVTPEAEEDAWETAIGSAVRYLWQRYALAGTVTDFRNEVKPVAATHIRGSRNTQNAAIYNTTLAFLLMQKKAQAQGVRFIVLFIPSMELVQAAFLSSAPAQLPAGSEQKMREERRMRALFMGVFTQNGIEYADALDATAKAYGVEIDNGRNLYPPDDQHPMEAGYAAYAKGLVDYLTLHPAAYYAPPEGN